MKKTVWRLLALICVFCLCCGCVNGATTPTTAPSGSVGYYETVNDVPAFSGKPYVELRNNVPFFDTLSTVGYELYAPLDYLGRCGVTVACVGIETMPTEERGAIGQVKPSGWHTVKYDFVDGKYLYNRCHLIGYQLTGENANECNLITGTRYMNVEGMLPFEDMVADYVKETKNHVMYRVTPIFDGVNLVARGVQMEAKSVEDKGRGVSFNVFVYNSQPGVVINYRTGESKDEAEINKTTVSVTTVPHSGTAEYVLNTSSKKFHLPSCKNAGTIKSENREISNAPREYLLQWGYEPCKSCNP
jgi:DNA-entry nuclease